MRPEPCWKQARRSSAPSGRLLYNLACLISQPNCYVLGRIDVDRQNDRQDLEPYVLSKVVAHRLLYAYELKVNPCPCLWGSMKNYPNHCADARFNSPQKGFHVKEYS